ncbi:MAG TPA: hypothetical protein PKN62_02590 [bacterium]|nr:hypothetical protein [bacterium]
MLVVTISPTEWHLFCGILWRILAAVLFWAVISNVTHALTGVK